MKSVAVKRVLALAASLALSGVACAANDTAMPVPQWSMLGTTLNFSADLLWALDVGKMSVSSYASGFVSAGKDTDGYYTYASAGAHLTSLTVSPESRLTTASSAGGFTLTAPVVKSVSSGGVLTVTDLTVDLSTKTIFATINGGNGVGTLKNFALWNFSQATGGSESTYVNPPCLAFTCMTMPLYAMPTTILSGLTITSDGQAKLRTALGLLSLGKAAFNGVTDYGVLTIGPVPEPSTYALMGLGLVGVGLAASRRRACSASPSM